MKKKILSLVLAFAILLNVVYCISLFSFSASALSGMQILEIKNLSKQYFEENNNASTKEGLEKTVKESFSSAKVSEFFIYRSADGCYDEDTNPDTRISISGHDGYASAVITVDSSSVGVLYTIPHTEKSLGTLTAETYSPENTDFVTKTSSGKLQIYQYKGTAQKIIIPSTFEGVIAKLNNSGYTDEKSMVKAVVIGGADKEMTVTVNNSAFVKMPNIEALVLPKTMNGKLNQFAFQELKSLKYVSLPQTIIGETADATTFSKGVFLGCAALVTAYYPGDFKLPKAKYAANSDNSGLKEQPFVNTSVDSFYLPDGITYADGYDAKIFNAPTKSQNTVIVMTDNDQKSVSLCRAATLAQQAADKISSADTAEKCLSTITDSFKYLIGGADIASSWNGTFTKNEDNASGTLTLTKGDASIDVNFNYNPNAGLSRLSVNDYSLSPDFNPDVTEYSITVPFTENDIAFDCAAMNGAKMIETVKGSALSIGENKDYIVIKTKSKSGKDVNYKVSVNRLEEKVDINNSIADAMNKYVKKTANECEKQELLDAVNAAISPNVAKIETGNDYFIYHSVDGCYDEDKDEATRLSIPGHDGYVSVIFKVYDKDSQLISTFGNISRIPHIEENLGVLSKSKDSDFEIDKDGNLKNYTGTAKKVIIPSNVKKIVSTGASSNTGLQKAVALIINSNCKVVDNSAFRSDAGGKWGWVNLKAINAFSVNQFGERSFSGLKSLKYVKLAAVSSNPTDYFGYACFADNTKLVNAQLPVSARLRGSVFSNTAIRDFIETSVNHQYAKTNEYYDYVKRSFKKGTSLILTSEENKSVNLTMAAVWAQIKANNFEVSESSTEESCLAEIKSTYSSKIGGEKIIAGFGSTFTHNKNKASGIVSLKQGNEIIKISFNCNPSAGLNYLEVEGQEITPDFSSDITNYNLIIPDTIGGLTINTCPANGAVINSIEGNTNISYGESFITVDTTAKDGTNVKYFINVNRLKVAEFLKLKANEAIAKYVKSVGNGCTKDGLVSAVNSGVSPYTAKLENNEYFIYHSVDGCYDEDEDEETRLSIPGHDGAVSAVFNFSKSGEADVQIALSAVIPHIEENFGKLTKSKASDFVIDGNGNIKEYNGCAEKVIVPSEINGTKVNNINSMSPKNAGAKKAIVIVTRNQGTTVSSQAFRSDSKGQYGFVNVVAADLSSNVIFGERAFSNLRNLKYLKLKSSNTVLKQDSSGKSYNERGYFDFASFADNPKLQNVNFPTNLTMRGRVFSGIAVYDIYERSGVVHNNTEEYANYQNPTIDSGERVVLTPEQGNQYSFTRIVDLVRISMSKTSIDADDDKSTVLGKCVNDAVVTGAKFDYNWNYYSESGGVVKAELFIKSGKYSIAIPFEYDKRIGLKEMFVSEIFTPAGLVKCKDSETDYKVDLYCVFDNLPISVSLQPGAKILSVTGNSKLHIGNNTVTVKIQSPDGLVTAYNIDVNRLPRLSMNQIISSIKNSVDAITFTNASGLDGIVSIAEQQLRGQPYSFAIRDSYMYKAINGAVENDKVLVPGHNGYLTVLLTVSEDNAASTEILLEHKIEPVMESYTFKTVSKAEDFKISEDGKTLLSYSGKAEKIVFPEGIEFIDELYMYSDTDDIKCIILPDSLRAIPSSFAYKMTKLEVFRMGDNVVKIGAGMCMNCASLKYVRLSESLPQLSSTMFSQTLSLAQLYIPQSVTNIGSNALYRSLVRDVTLSKQVKYICENAFSWCINNATYFSQGALGSIVTPELGNKLQKEIVSKIAYNGGVAVPRTITVLNPEIEVEPGAFAGDTTGAWGMNAVKAKEGSVFDHYFENISESSSSFAAKKNYSHLDMPFIEVVARAKVTAENIKLEKDATADLAKSIIESSYFSVEPVKASWIKELKSENGRFIGKLQLSGSDYSTTVDIDTPVFVKAELLPEEATEETDDEYETDDDYTVDDDDYEYDEESYDYEPGYSEESYYGTHEETTYKTVKTKLLKKMRRVLNVDFLGIPIWIWIVGCSVVVIAGASATVFIIVRKKKIHKK